jgi:hypothetical protein
VHQLVERLTGFTGGVEGLDGKQSQSESAARAPSVDGAVETNEVLKTKLRRLGLSQCRIWL